MYNIEREKCQDRERTWLLKINGHTFGVVEIVHMTDTLRSIVGQFTAYTQNGFEEIKVTYDCDKVKHRVSYSINNFVEDIQKVIAGRELHIPRELDEYAPEQIVVADDVNDNTVDVLAEVLQLDLTGGTPTHRAEEMRDYLREEREKNMACPMRDLVQKSKLAKTRATPVHIHSEW